MNRSKRICLGAAQSGGGPLPLAWFRPIAQRRLRLAVCLHVLAVLLSPARWSVLLTPLQPTDALPLQATRQIFLPPDLGAALASDEAALLLPDQRLTRSRNCQTLGVPRQSRGFP
jgi:hypothetical protein